jgi:uncharacterized protein (DUF2062 family)
MNEDERALIESLGKRLEAGISNVDRRVEEHLSFFKREMDRFYEALCRHTTTPHCTAGACSIGIELEHHVKNTKGRLAKVWQIVTMILSAVIGGIVAKLGFK